MLKSLLLTFFLFSQNLLAAWGNYNSILIGDQAAGMGGAGTSLVGDASSAAWYNPATMAWLEGESFSAAVGIYKKFDTKYGDFEDIKSASLTVNQGFFRALPSSTGSVVRFNNEYLKDYTLALSIVTPEFESFKGDIKNSNESKSTLQQTDESLWVGGAIAKKISSTESLGLTLYYTAKSFSRFSSDRKFISSSQTQIYTEERSYTQNAIVPVLGYWKSLNEFWSLGISARVASIQVAGAGTYFENTFDPIDTSKSKTINLSDVGSKARIPERYTLGLSYKEPENVLFALDISAYGREQYRDIDSEEVGEQIEHNAIWNVSFGTEVYFRPWLMGRVGWFTNFSSHPEPDATKVRGQGDRVDQLGFSANMALKKGNILYTFGGYYTGGRGHSVQHIDQRYQSIPKTQQVFTMLVGTSYHF